MTLIELLCHLSDPGCRLDIYQPIEEGKEDAECVWTGIAWDVPNELHERIIEAFDVNASGLDIDLI